MSSAFTTAGFQTVNDKVLMEMNLRAQRQLEEAAKTPPKQNIFDFGAQSSHQSTQRPRSPGWSKRFSQLHGRQFARMESIDTHPSLKGRRPSPSRQPKLVMNTQTKALQPPLFGAAPSMPTDEKRQGGLLESPSKRRRTVVRSDSKPQLSSYVPIQSQPTVESQSRSHRPALQTGSFRSRANRAGAGAGAGAGAQAKAQILSSPAQKITRSHTTAHISSQLEPAFDRLPSYARPTQAALRKSHSTRALATRSESTLNQIPVQKSRSISRQNQQHSPREASQLFAQLDPAPRSALNSSRVQRL